MPNLCKIADLVIAKLSVQQETINLKQLQKIIYFSHGFHLLLLKEPMVAQKVVLSGYRQYILEIDKKYSSMIFDWNTIERALDYKNSIVERIVSQVIKHYDRLTLIQLGRASKNKSALDIAKKLDMDTIPNSLIREVFAEEFGISQIEDLDIIFG